MRARTQVDGARSKNASCGISSDGRTDGFAQRVLAIVVTVDKQLDGGARLHHARDLHCRVARGAIVFAQARI